MRDEYSMFHPSSLYVMCSIFFAYKSHAKYRLILAANRDEFYERPTAKAGNWVDYPDVLAGRDLKYGGTWLGITKNGKLAAVTNYRDTAAPNGILSRGHLVSNFLIRDEPAQNYLQSIQNIANKYSGFNLLAGDRDSLCYFSNRESNIKLLDSGIYGLSNHLLDTPWQKVVKGKSAISKIVDKDVIDVEELFEMLTDNQQAVDSDLPNTGIGKDKERMLSPIFIATPIYGTRSSTVLLIDDQNKVTFVERTFRNGLFDGVEMNFNFKF